MKIINKRAFYDYEISDRFEAGITLIGPEVKAVRLGHADLAGSHVRIVGSEGFSLRLWLDSPKARRTTTQHPDPRLRHLRVSYSRLVAPIFQHGV